MAISSPTATTTRDGGKATVAITGYISKDADEALTAALGGARDADRILLSFAADCFLNSVGIAILLDLILPLKDEGKEIRIVHPSAHFRRVFEIMGLSRDVPVHAAEGESTW